MLLSLSLTTTYVLSSRPGDAHVPRALGLCLLRCVNGKIPRNCNCFHLLTHHIMEVHLQKTEAQGETVQDVKAVTAGYGSAQVPSEQGSLCRKMPWSRVRSLG